jgi:hypothetical protein
MEKGRHLLWFYKKKKNHPKRKIVAFSPQDGIREDSKVKEVEHHQVAASSLKLDPDTASLGSQKGNCL